MINKYVSLYAIEEKLKLDRYMMRKWKNDEEKLRLVKNKDKKYLTNRGREIKRTMTESYENDICNFIKENREKKKAIGAKSVIFYAGKINPKFKEKSLKIKLMWCYRFIKRNGFSIRRVSHIGQSIPEDKNTLKDSFYKRSNIKKEKNEYSL